MSATPPSGPSYFSDNPYQTPGSDLNQPRRGMVNQVRVVAILNAFQGLLELLMALLYGGMGVMFGVFLREEMRQGPGPAGGPDPEMMANIFTGLFAFMAVGMVVIAILRIVAGVRNYFFQNRILGIVSVCLGLVTSMTVYCAPTSIAVAVYALVVLFNREVIEAFEMRSKGATPDDVTQTFNARPY